MKKLFLSSSFSDVVSILKDFYKESFVNKKVAFIPIASYVEEVDFYVEEARKSFAELGAEIVEVNLDEYTSDEVVKRVQKSDMIYVSGGNSFYLLQEFKHSGLDEVIKKEVEKGKLYIGESAGSIILAPDIEYIKDMDNHNVARFLSDFKALELVDFFPLPHVGEFPFEEASTKIMETYNNKLNLVPINNKQVILVEGDSFKIV